MDKGGLFERSNVTLVWDNSMFTAQVFSTTGETLPPVELPDHIFGIEPSEPAIYQVVKAYLNHQRQGTVSTKNRSAVRGSGRKPWRQKGTGRARVGTYTSPLFVGGGVIFGPAPRCYREKAPKKLRRLALKSALSLRAREGAVRVVEDLELDAPRTKAVVAWLRGCGIEGHQRALLLTDGVSEVLYKSTRNLPHVVLRPVQQVCTYDVMYADIVVFTRTGLARGEEVLS